MSGRITVFVLAASTALIASQARADRECFENSCRLPEVVEPPAAAVAAPPAPEAAPVAAPMPAAAAMPPKADTGRAAANQAPAEAKQLPRPKLVHHTEPPAPPTRPAKSAPSYAKAAPAPTPRPIAVREPAPLPADLPPRESLAAVPSTRYPTRVVVAERGYRGSGAAIVNAPEPVYQPEGIATVRPYIFYTENHAPRLYVLAPNAKIISVDDGLN